MRLTRGRPHPALRGVVSGYADFAERTGSPRETWEAPGGAIVVILDLDTGWTVEGRRFGSFAGGIYARPVRVRHEGSSCGVQLDLEPIAARALLGVRSADLAERTVALEDLLGVDAGLLAERLHDAPDPRARFAILDEALLQRVSDRPSWVRPEVERAWSLMRASGGQIRVETLARALGCSRRHLTSRFAEEVGVPPKLAARLIRFEAARGRLGSVPLARLAADHGYADQAHLTREFRALAGAPPTTFPILQDDGRPAGVGSAA
jgi:AraC-like DNA-binding protein